MIVRPTIMKAGSVLGLIAGRKTQTRRVARTEADARRFRDGHLDACPFEPGMWLWVREAWAPWEVYCPHGKATNLFDSKLPWSTSIVFRADLSSHNAQGWGRLKSDPLLRWRSPLFMPRWAARFWLEVLSVDCERVQDISKADAVAEGVEGAIPIDGEGFRWRDYSRTGGNDPCEWFADPRESYRTAWDSINGRRAPWKKNPSVWVVTFKRIQLRDVPIEILQPKRAA